MLLNIILWPFRLVWGITSLLFNLLGRMAAAVIGVVLMAVGLVLSITIIGVVVGIPLIITGALLTIRAIF